MFRNKYVNQALILTLFPLVLVAGCTRVTRVQEIVPESSSATRAESITVGPGSWPWWWGPNQNAVSDEQQVPTQWSETDNVVWKTEVPGRGHSSPCVWEQRIFLTTADEASGEHLLLCYDRATGQQQWTRAVHEGGFMKMHRKNSHASATAACDGQHVYTVFIHDGAVKVTATSLDGEIVWQKDAGPFTSEHGYGSSPVIYGSLIIVLGDSRSGSFIAGLARETGEIVWRTVRRTNRRYGSYATPIVAEVAGKPQLLVTGASQVTSYHPATGKLVWFCEGPAEVTACTMASNGQLVFASGGYPEKELLAIRADGEGDVTDSHIVWSTHKGASYVPSPLYHAGKLFVVNDDGIAMCFQADTGKQLGRKRLDGEFSSSPILCNGRIYVCNEAGKTLILAADSSFEELSQNDLGDGGFASPAICGEQILIRTLHRLYCIAHPASAGSPFTA